ncbi:MAG: response regulator transcription factor [Pseudomonadota bacterium]
MIIIVDDRDVIADAYAASFDREGIAAAGFSAKDFDGWVASAADDDISSVNAFLLGECEVGAQLANLIRRRSAAAVIAVQDERSLDETLELFSLGFDDVVRKPCHAKEIMARVAAITRRAQSKNRDSVRLGEIIVFCDGRDPLVRGESLPLPRRELRILELLILKQGRRITKSQIFNSVYGLFEQGIEETVIESHISKLRRRLRGALGYDPIESKRHLGYRIVDSVGADVTLESARAS